jgi:hypothetical protein
MSKQGRGGGARKEKLMTNICQCALFESVSKRLIAHKIFF